MRHIHANVEIKYNTQHQSRFRFCLFFSTFNVCLCGIQTAPTQNRVHIIGGAGSKTFLHTIYSILKHAMPMFITRFSPHANNEPLTQRRARKILRESANCVSAKTGPATVIANAFVCQLCAKLLAAGAPTRVTAAAPGTQCASWVPLCRFSLALFLSIYCCSCWHCVPFTNSCNAVHCFAASVTKVPMLWA